MTCRVFRNWQLTLEVLSTEHNSKLLDNNLPMPNTRKKFLKKILSYCILIHALFFLSYQ